MTEPETGARPRLSARSVAVLGATALVAVALDQWVKWLSTEHLTEGHPVRILGGLIYLSLLRNSGAAFSMGTAHTWIFPVITLIVIGESVVEVLRDVPARGAVWRSVVVEAVVVLVLAFVEVVYPPGKKLKKLRLFTFLYTRV